MLKRAIAMSLEQEEEEEEELSSIKGEQKNKQKRWIVTNVHKLSTFQVTQTKRCPQLGMRRGTFQLLEEYQVGVLEALSGDVPGMRRGMVMQRWRGRALVHQTR